MTNQPCPSCPFEHSPQFRAVSLAPVRGQGRLLVRRRILEQRAPPQGVIPNHVREELHEHVGWSLVLLELKHHVAERTFLEPGDGWGLRLEFKTLDVELGHVNARPAAVVFGPHLRIACRHAGGLESGGKIAQDRQEVRSPGCGPRITTEHPNNALNALSANVAVNLAKAHATIFLGLVKAAPGHHREWQESAGHQMGDVIVVHLMVDHRKHVGRGDGGGWPGSLDAKVGNRWQGGSYGGGPVPHVHAGIKDRQAFAMLPDFGILERLHDPLPIKGFKQEVLHGFIGHIIVLPKAKYNQRRLWSHWMTSSMLDPTLSLLDWSLLR
jgi:hypothetical protein